jgi:hypothetical protein
LRRPALVAGGLAVLLLPAPLLAQGTGDQYAIPTPTPTPAPAAAEPPAPPVPVLGRKIVLERVSGKVRYHVPGSKPYARLGSERVAVPVGTHVDARAGRVRVIVARKRRGTATWRSLFYDGRFDVTQPEYNGAVTDITMIGGSFEDCAKASIARAARKHRRVRRLWGDGHGRFRTSGRFSAATVRGTKWLVEDRCDGTLTRVARGVVDVEDFTVQQPKPTTQPPLSGGGEDGGSAPAPEQAPAVGTPRHRKVRKGQSYVASPGG